MRTSISILKALTTFLLFVNLAASKNYYDEKRGLAGVYYSFAAYCAYETLDNWNCGEACTAHSSIETISKILDKSLDTFAFVTYNPSDNEIVVAFRGTNSADMNNWATNIEFSLVQYKDHFA